MHDDQEQPEESFAYESVGTMLRQKREAQDPSLADIADKTRVPIRHLKAIEASDHDALPALTYEIGFAKAYARAVGVDEQLVAGQLHEEVGDEPRQQRRGEQDNFQPADPARTPPRMLAWTAALIAVLLVIGYGVWRGLFWSGESDDPYLPEQTTVAQSAAAVPAVAAPTPPAGPTADGQVVLTASKEVWVRVYNADNETLLIKTLAPGERYEVPKQANNPMINIGRPEAVTVTINGQNVAPLGPPERAIKDVGISAQALIARDEGAAQQPAA